MRLSIEAAVINLTYELKLLWLAMLTRYGLIVYRPGMTTLGGELLKPLGSTCVYLGQVPDFLWLDDPL